MRQQYSHRKANGGERIDVKSFDKAPSAAIAVMTLIDLGGIAFFAIAVALYGGA